MGLVNISCVLAKSLLDNDLISDHPIDDDVSRKHRL